MFLRLIVVFVFVVLPSLFFLLYLFLLSGFARFALKAVRLLMRQSSGWSSACAILKDAPKTGSKVSTFVMAQACQNVLVLPSPLTREPPPPPPSPTQRDLRNQFVSHDVLLTYRAINIVYEPIEVVRKCVCMQRNSKSNLFGRFLGNLF